MFLGLFRHFKFITRVSMLKKVLLILSVNQPQWLSCLRESGLKKNQIYDIWDYNLKLLMRFS